MNSIIIFDDECVLCNRSVAFIIRNDPQEKFRFTHAKSETTSQLLGHQPQISPTESLILYENDVVYHASDAALRIARQLRQPWPVFYIFIIIPGFLRNFLYRLIARNRYSVFGKCASCMVINDENKHLFLP
mgnify:CR=1 FL=1